MQDLDMRGIASKLQTQLLTISDESPVIATVATVELVSDEVGGGWYKQVIHRE